MEAAQSVLARSAVDLWIEAHRIWFAALVGDADDLLSDTHTWLGDNQLRKGVAYLVAPGSSLAFGARSVFRFRMQEYKRKGLPIVPGPLDLSHAADFNAHINCLCA